MKGSGPRRADSAEMAEYSNGHKLVSGHKLLGDWFEKHFGTLGDVKVRPRAIIIDMQPVPISSDKLFFKGLGLQVRDADWDSGYLFRHCVTTPRKSQVFVDRSLKPLVKVYFVLAQANDQS